MDKLKNAAASKKAKAVSALTKKYGDLGYLEPSKDAFKDYIK